MENNNQTNRHMNFTSRTRKYIKSLSFIIFALLTFVSAVSIVVYKLVDDLSKIDPHYWLIGFSIVFIMLNILSSSNMIKAFALGFSLIKEFNIIEPDKFSITKRDANDVRPTIENEINLSTGVYFKDNYGLAYFLYGMVAIQNILYGYLGYTMMHNPDEIVMGFTNSTIFGVYSAIIIFCNFIFLKFIKYSIKSAFYGGQLTQNIRTTEYLTNLLGSIQIEPIESEDNKDGKTEELSDK